MVPWREIRIADALLSPLYHSSITGHFGEEVYESGLLKYRFKMLEDALEAPTTSPDNSCKCVKKREADKARYCTMDGILDISECKRGAPVVISKPHFFLGSPVLRQQFTGLEPERGLHESFFDVDPVSETNAVSFDYLPLCQAMF